MSKMISYSAGALSMMAPNDDTGTPSFVGARPSLSTMMVALFIESLASCHWYM